MKRGILISLVAALVCTACSAQSPQEQSRTSGCKPGNLLESDASTVEQMGHFLNGLKAAVASGERQRVARFVRYPLPVATADAQVTIRSEQEFVKNYTRILPPQLRDLLLRQETSCISRVGAKGFTIGTGEVWFDRFQDGKVKIFGITAVTYPR